MPISQKDVRSLPKSVRDRNLLTKEDQITKLLGQGTFGKVVQARDQRRNQFVAVKVIRSVQKYRDASRIELRVLSTLKANDDDNRNRCIHLRDCFDYRGHICIVMDLYSQSVFDFLKSNSFVPFPNSQIQNFAHQLFTSIACKSCCNLLQCGSQLTHTSPPRSQPHTYGPKARKHIIMRRPIPDFHI